MFPILMHRPGFLEDRWIITGMKGYYFQIEKKYAGYEKVECGFNYMLI